jgi:hypothetical protein
MKPSPKMKEEIEKLAQKHEVPLAQVGEYLRLDMPHYDRLCVEKIGVNRISVTHYFEVNGDLVPDPDIVFFVTDNGDWCPIGINQSIGGWRSYVKMTADGIGIEACDTVGQADLANFAEIWAQNIADQGWLERASCTDSFVATAAVSPNTKWPAPETDAPDMETIFEWLLMDGDCEATDGCLIEPDGVCPHGYPSWLIQLGMI